MNLKEQKYVWTLAHCGTISKAAEELYLSAPALSVFLSNLEKQLGVQLFERTGKRLLPTEIGREYLSRAEVMLKMKEDFDRLVEERTGSSCRTLRVGIQQRRAIFTVPKLMSMFLKEYPEVNLIFREGVYDELMKLYEDGDVDFLLNVFERELENSEILNICEEPILIAIPGNHSALEHIYRKGEDAFPHINLSCLDGEHFILPAKTQSLRITVEQLFKEYDIHPSRIIEIGNFETAMAMVDNGIGIGFNRMGYIKAMRSFANVQYCLIGEEPFSSQLFLAYRKNRVLLPHMERFVELLRECIENS